MTAASWLVAGSALIAWLAPSAALAQQPAQPHPMSFFITSVPIGKGGDLGGVAGPMRSVPGSRPPRAPAAAPGTPI